MSDLRRLVLTVKEDGHELRVLYKRKDGPGPSTKARRRGRAAGQDLAELQSVSGYLQDAQRIVEHAVGRISGQVVQDTMIYGEARHRAIQYEREADGESSVEKLPYDYGMDGNRWEGGGHAA